MIKQLFLAMALLVVCQVSYGQISFSHSIGAAFYVGGNAGAPAILYSPRINAMELDDELTISVGTHIGLGLSANSREGASSLALDLPLMVEINFGHGANSETRSTFGGFAGIGYGINKVGSSGTFDSDYNEGSGLVVNGGVRAIVNNFPLGVRVSYLLNSKEDFSNVFSIGAFFTFGNF